MLVRDILKTKGSDTITISVDHHLADAVALLAKRRIGALPVLSSSGAIKGILSERDIVRALGLGLDPKLLAFEVHIDLGGAVDEAVERLLEPLFRRQLLRLGDQNLLVRLDPRDRRPVQFVQLRGPADQPHHGRLSATGPRRASPDPAHSGKWWNCSSGNVVAGATLTACRTSSSPSTESRSPCQRAN